MALLKKVQQVKVKVLQGLQGQQQVLIMTRLT
jgi:hypothetical protein